MLVIDILAMLAILGVFSVLVALWLGGPESARTSTVRFDRVSVGNGEDHDTYRERRS